LLAHLLLAAAVTFLFINAAAAVFLFITKPPLTPLLTYLLQSRCHHRFPIYCKTTAAAYKSAATAFLFNTKPPLLPYSTPPPTLAYLLQRSRHCLLHICYNAPTAAKAFLFNTKPLSLLLAYLLQFSPPLPLISNHWFIVPVVLKQE
jgi:hypothetical protein